MRFWKTLLFLPLLCTALHAAPPNIIVILADDMGFSDIGCYGSEIQTPNLDSLAENGLRFTQFYNTSRCCPTRASLLTGLWSHQAGIGGMTNDEGFPGYRGKLNRRCVTLAEALKPAGYTTLMTGKWHVGSGEGLDPLDRGFERFWGTTSGGGVYFKEALKIRKGLDFYHNREKIEVPDDLYVTDDFTDQGIGFIEEAVTKTKLPFFLYLAHIAPHWPLQAKPEDIAKYEDGYEKGWDDIRQKRFARQLEMGIIPENTILSPRDSKAKAWNELPEATRKDLAHRMAVYAAQIDCIDQNVGKLIKKLKELDQFENTLILFLSDNGCSAEGDAGGFSRGKKGAPIGSPESYASVGLEWANASDTPFRKFKTFTHQGGIATPLIAHWPAGISAKGELRHQPGHVIDIMPTLIELSGAAYPEKFGDETIKPMEGRSLAPVFKTDTATTRDLFWEHMRKKAVRRGDWKVVSTGKGSWQLYDLKKDPTETNDLSRVHPKKSAELVTLWKDWATRCDVLKERKN